MADAAGGQGTANDAMVKTESWYPASPSFTASGLYDWSLASGWPSEISVEKWERNDSGERRIVARRRYVLAEE